MKKLKLLHLVMDEMESQMLDFGFKKSFSKQKFLKSIDKDFILGYSLSVYDKFNIEKRKSGIIIEPALYIHYKPIELVYSKITTRHLNYITDLITVGNQLADLIANPSGEYLIHNTSLSLYNYEESDAFITSNILVTYFRSFALKYFETNACISGLESILNNNIDITSVHCYNNEPERSIRGIIAAKLFNNQKSNDLIGKQVEKIKILGNDNYLLELERLMSIYPLSTEMPP